MILKNNFYRIGSVIVLLAVTLFNSKGQNNTGKTKGATLVKLLHNYDSLMNTRPSQAAGVLLIANQMVSSGGTHPSLLIRLNAANARWWVEQKNCDSSMYYAQKAIHASQNTGDSISALISLGAAFRCYGKHDSALSSYFGAEKLAFAIKDTLSMIRSFFYLGHVHSELGKFDKAEGYYAHSNNLANQLNNKEFIARTNLAMASNMADRGLMKQALVALQNALIPCENEGLLGLQATAYNNLGLVCRELELYEKALAYFQQSLQIQTLFGNHYEMATEYNNMAMIRILQNRLNDAIPLLHKAEQYSDILPEVYHNLALCYSETGNYKKAFFFKSIQKMLDDSLRDIELLKRTEMLQEQFEAGKRKMEIENLRQENEVKELKNKVHVKQRDIFIGLALALMFISILIYFILRQKVKNAKRMDQKNKQIHQQEVEELIRNSELLSMRTMIDTQEKERRRIAEDLHDRVGSMLSTIKLRFSHLIPANQIGDAEQSAYQKLSQLIDETCEEIRLVSHNLVSGVLDTFGLIPALLDLKEALSKNGLEISITSYNMSARVPKVVEINLYHMMQELFNNTIRHANATAVTIDITRHKNQLTLIYHDNGIGFETGVKGLGIGLRSIQSRIDKLGGTLHIDSGKGNGSTFVIIVNCYD